MAQKRRKGPTHYACDAYGELLETHAIIASMSRKGDCWDSRRGEFLRGAQDGARRRHGVDDPRGSARGGVSLYRDVVHPKRWHSSPGRLSPMEFEARQPHNSVSIKSGGKFTAAHLRQRTPVACG